MPSEEEINNEAIRRMLNVHSGGLLGVMRLRYKEGSFKFPLPRVFADDPDVLVSVEIKVVKMFEDKSITHLQLDTQNDLGVGGNEIPMCGKKMNPGDRLIQEPDDELKTPNCPECKNLMLWNSLNPTEGRKQLSAKLRNQTT
jgi:hypothetical protein